MKPQFLFGLALCGLCLVGIVERSAAQAHRDNPLYPTTPLRQLPSSAVPKSGGGDNGATVVSYQLDDGSAEFPGGNGSPGFQSHIVLNHFTTAAGGETLRSISFPWPGDGVAPTNGDPATLYVWDDPNGDGDPADAALLGSWDVDVQNAGSVAVFTHYSIAPTTVGPSFFVGYGYEGTNPAGIYSRFLDIDAPAGASWIADSIGVSSDPENLAAATYYGATPENLMIRASAWPIDQLANCSFETGEFSGWIAKDMAAPYFPPLGVMPPMTQSWLSTLVADGSYIVMHGFDGGGPDTIELAQDLQIPYNATTLEFDYRAIYSHSGLARTFDVHIERQGGGAPFQSTNILTSIPDLLVHDSGNQVGTVDLRGFRGQTVRIRFSWNIPESFTGPGQFEFDAVRVNTMSSSLGLYFDAGFSQTTLVDPLPNTPYQAYLVAKGIPSAGIGNGISGWESLVDWPKELTILGATLQPPGALNLGSGEDYIVGLPSCTGSQDLDIVLLQVLFLVNDVGVDAFAFGPTNPSSFPGSGVGWSDCDDVLREFDSLVLPTIQFTTQPGIESIVDVPDDQGHWLRLAIDAPAEDAAGNIVGYNVWREVRSAIELQRAQPSREFAQLGAVELDGRVLVVNDDTASKEPGALPAGVWEIVASFYATQKARYDVVAPTVVDNAADSYCVTAHTTSPALWNSSPVKTGTSLDNLPPALPSGLIASYDAAGVTLNWELAPEDDFDFWRVYRDTDPDFEVAAHLLVQELVVPTWFDATAQPWGYHYKVAAVDHAGNEGAAVAPQTLVDSEPALPARTMLYPAMPNPFNPSTEIQFELGRSGPVRLTIYAVNGRLIRTLVDGRHEAGRHTVRWDGSTDSGAAAASGVYLYQLESGDELRTERMTLLK